MGPVSPAMAVLGALWWPYQLVAAFLEAVGSSRSTGAVGKSLTQGGGRDEMGMKWVSIALGSSS